MTEATAWKPLDLLKTTTDWLAAKGVPGARRDAELLLCHALGLEARIELYAAFERLVAPGELDRFRRLAGRRARREPVSRILGRREFMSLDFAVTPAVLSPRPETELLVEAALRILRPPPRPRDDLLDDDNDNVNVNGNGLKSAAPAVGEAGGPKDAVASDPEADDLLNRMLDEYAEGGDEDEEPPPDTDSVVTSAGPLNSQPERDGNTIPDSPRNPRSPEAVAGPHAATATVFNKRKGKAKSERPPPALAPAARAAPRRVLDLGTGSGCVAVSVAAFCPEARVTAVDISPDALAVAAANARTLGVEARVEFRRGDWWDALGPEERFDLVLSNPPYLVEGDESIEPEARDFDPAVALYGGVEGLDFYHRLAGQLAARLLPDGAVLTEVGAGQGERVLSILSAALPGHAGEILADGAGHGRVVVLTPPPAKG